MYMHSIAYLHLVNDSHFLHNLHMRNEIEAYAAGASLFDVESYFDSTKHPYEWAHSNAVIMCARMLTCYLFR